MSKKNPFYIRAQLLLTLAMTVHVLSYFMQASWAEEGELWGQTLWYSMPTSLVQNAAFPLLNLLIAVVLYAPMAVLVYGTAKVIHPPTKRPTYGPLTMGLLLPTLLIWGLLAYAIVDWKLDFEHAIAPIVWSISLVFFFFGFLYHQMAALKEHPPEYLSDHLIDR